MRAWQGRSILVTGATGIVGSWLVKELLADGAAVVALVYDQDPQSELVRSGDLERIASVDGALEEFDVVEGAIREHEVDTVFHLGAQTLVEVARDDPLATWETNVRGTYNVLEACRRQAGQVQRVVVASSDKAYGDSAALPYTEKSPLAARYPYDASKACADLIAHSYHATYGLPIAVARCGNVYGGGDLNWSRIVPGTIRSLLQGEHPAVRSDGSYRRDYLYVRDVARAYVDLGAALGTDGVAGEAFNFGHEQPVTVLEIVSAIARLMEREELEPIIQDRAVGEIRDQWLSAAKAKDVLGWSPRYDLDTGLSETIDWYRSFLG